MLTDAVRRFVREQRLAFVATVCEDGSPNLSPKGSTRALDDRHLVFADIRSPQTVRNLRHRPAVEIAVVDVCRRAGYRFKGDGRVVESGDELTRAEAFLRAEGVAEPFDAVVIVSVQAVSEIRSPGYDGGQTVRQIEARWQAYWCALWKRRRREAAGSEIRDDRAP